MLVVVLDIYEGGKDLIPGWKLKEHAESALATDGIISGAGQRLLRQIGLRLLKLRPLRVRALAERYELRVQRSGFVAIA